jgi:hypothetical protein
MRVSWTAVQIGNQQSAISSQLPVVSWRLQAEERLVHRQSVNTAAAQD